jgi:hypothetical protein
MKRETRNLTKAHTLSSRFTFHVSCIPVYRELDSSKIIDTTRAIAGRVSERLPNSGLSKVAADVVRAAQDAAELSARVERPMWLLRAAGALLTLAFGALLVTVIRALHQVPMDPANASDLVQGVAAFVDDLVFASVAVWFAFSLETRVKRKAVLRLISQLRALAHVIDMHQFTKDPDFVNERPAEAPPPSGKVSLTRPLLVRYLDYCSELLSILAKLAALCVQRFEDPVTLAAVNDLEDLTSGLSRKVWQKIMIIDRVEEGERKT